MARKKLDVNVTKEAIERNFILLNAALAEYDKRIAALQGCDDEGLSSEAKAELTALIAKYKAEINVYIRNALAALNFTLDDYWCVFANIAAQQGISLKIVNAGVEKSAIKYNASTGTWQVSYNSEAFDIGDMRMEVYDANSNGIVDMSEGVVYIDLTTPAENGQALLWDEADGKFKPRNVNRNIDGGAAVSVFLSVQTIDGGGADG